MVDAMSRRFGDDRLRSKGHARPGSGEHREVVRTVAHAHCVRHRYGARRRCFLQPLLLGVPAEDRRDRSTGQPSVFHLENIRMVLVEAELLSHIAGERQEPTGDYDGVRAMCSHRRNEGTRTGHERDTLFDDRVDIRLWSPLQKRHPLALRVLEVDLPAHRPLRDRRDPLADAGHVRQLVDAFLLDQGRVHVGDQKRTPADLVPHDHVDRLAVEPTAQLVRGGFRATLQRHLVRKDADTGEADLASDRFGKNGEVGTADQDGRSGHGMKSLSALPDVVLLAGPTASGKSAVAMELATEVGGTVVNADSIQVYGELRVLTARPTAEDEGRVPHALYGHVSASAEYSVASWIEDLRTILAARASDGPLVVCGGTGLYFSAALDGLADVPPIEGDVRERTRSELLDSGPEALWQVLHDADDVAADKLRPTDGQRIARALEVVRSTGRPLSWWQAQPRRPSILAKHQVDKYLLFPDREETRARIERRAGEMLADAALPLEIESIRSLGLSSDRPAVRAIGVSAATDWIEGKATLETTHRRISIDTARYAKRQRTWFRNRFGDWHVAAPREIIDRYV